MTQTTTPHTLPEVSIPCAECDIPINPATAGTLRLCADCKGDYERWLSRLAPHEQARHLAARASQEAEEKAETLQQAHDGGDHDTKFSDGCSSCEDLIREHAQGDHDGDPRQDCAACVVSCADCERSYGPGTKCRCNLRNDHDEDKRYADPIHPTRQARILRDVTESEASR